MTRAFITDCEGPISKNDNAYETTSYFVRGGGRLFTIISRYDDVVADILHRPGYRAGETVKLVLPFLKACGVTDKLMEEYALEHLVLIADIKESLRCIRDQAESFIVSTSYEHYIRAMCQVLNFPCKNAFCTSFGLDNYMLSSSERQRLMEIAARIRKMPLFEIPPEADSLESLPLEIADSVEGLDEIFKEIGEMEIGEIYRDVNTMGGSEKAAAVRAASKCSGVKLCNVMYVGDSITDVQAFQLVKQKGGFAVSFNGNRFAVENAEIVVLSKSAFATAILANVFIGLGKGEALRFAENWNRDTLMDSPTDPRILKRFFEIFPHKLPLVEKVTKRNMASLAERSASFRKKVRGETIGRLG